ncbi:MAG TPA: hypothetical protein VLA74_09625 [Nitrososphaeraceae archaeon]|nr:hypothetical protein [Nitrososphaeraceae archaeon]
MNNNKNNKRRGGSLRLMYYYIHVLYSGFSSKETKTEELAKQKTSIEKSCHGLPSRVMYIDP